MSARGNSEDHDSPEPPDTDPEVPDPEVPDFDPADPDAGGFEPHYPEDYPDEEWEYENGEGRRYLPRDSQIDAAKQFLTDEFFPRNPGRVFYSKQIQVLIEDAWAVEKLTGEKRPGFYHWITEKALRELDQERKLESKLLPLGDFRPPVAETGEDPSGTTIRFYWSPQMRYTSRAIAKSMKLVRAFSAPGLSHAIGNNAEMMFDAALPKVGFLPKAENVREWAGRRWEKTQEDLDRVFEKDGIHYGVEIKNRLSYIGKEVLRSKLEMCQFLGLVPLFILRASAKSYNHLINQNGGYALLFRWQLYPPGQEKLAAEVREKSGLAGRWSQGD